MVFLFLVMIKSGGAQTVESATINSTGNSFDKGDVIFEWSIGELALVKTMFNSKAIITNGLLQPLSPMFFISEGFILVPNNILTANGDGKNDTWMIKDVEQYPDNEVTILDRAGRIVYHTKNYKNTWAGPVNLPGQDTYYYIIKLKKGGKSGIVKGFITILN